KKSFYKIAEIYEAHELSACFNVIASGHLPRFRAVDDWILPELMGNFEDWNALQARGHEIMPHSWKHLNLGRQPLRKSKRLIMKCLRYFEQNLDGFKMADAVFNFPFNASTPELDAFVLSKVMAVRGWGDGPVNVVPVQEPLRLGCTSNGPNNIDGWVEQQVNEFLQSEGGWLILNLHGLDGEGWGPVSESYLRQLIGRLVKMEQVEIAPTGRILSRLRENKS
ncbi:MAG: hypothetical protein AAFO94_19870, partial [Bacteroidota bacterium]